MIPILEAPELGVTESLTYVCCIAMWFLGKELRQVVSDRMRSYRAPLCFLRRKANDSCIVEVEGVVEYKSLPSGLHNVREDLM